ncbi:hemerythrin domain-containing protein [Flavihumibacter rivuli]|uniref:hemerythrin domain-containing protein n=1 Tax=Flavihumibacter rivuli TaxID=2838156 RepID=UPI001BDE38C0|nr:hemerythrin domain-containing protein [Flavihumibacter rivuli]ULQ55212.1 hemerythrin domain-containing protein [Flavihumibacter rivuli]
MSRYNIFYQIHKALRAMLYETSIQLQQTDFSNAEQTAQTLAQVTEVAELFEKHAATEDHFILGTIEQFEPQAAELFEAEHEEDHILGEKLVSKIQNFHSRELPVSKQQLGLDLTIAFTEFMVFNLNHMAKEEKELNELLWKHFSDEDLGGITQQILAYLPHDFHARYNKWMMRGLSNNEISQWLKMVGASAPQFVFDGLVATMEAELPKERSHAIRQSLADTSVYA